MRLQVKELRALAEIMQNADTTATLFSATVTADAQDVFTCVFNRDIERARPGNNGDCPLSITLNIYNDQSVPVGNPVVLSVQETDIIGNNSFNFRLTVPNRVGGNTFYIHAVLLNNIGNAQNVSFTVSSYHTTIKQIFIYERRQIARVYWSDSEFIRNMEAEEDVRRTVFQNEEAFLHIKTKGMYNDPVTLVISDANDREILRRTNVRMNANKKVIAIRIQDIITRYRTLTSKPTGNLTLSLKANVSLSAERTEYVTVTQTRERTGWETAGYIAATIITLPITIFSGCSDNRRGGSRGSASTISSVDSTCLNISFTDAESANRATSTGTVYVNVNSTNENENLQNAVPTEFTDFRIGRICHLLGVGDLQDKYNNALLNIRLTVYPFRIYDIMLSDLVVSGIITLDDAVVIGPPPATQTDEARRRQKSRLEETFNKLTQPITNDAGGNTRVLLDIFGRTERFGTNNVYKLNETEKVRKILAIVQTKPSVFVRDICRDAWQGDSDRYRAGRYNYAKECPSGEYFINYKGGGKYRVMVSQYASSAYIESNVDAIACITDYPSGIGQLQPRRGSIALHKGGAQASIGCITFNIQHTRPDNNYGTFTNVMYGTANNSRYLNFICIDERNALQNTEPDHRYYDLIKPPRGGSNNADEYLTP